MAYFDPTKQTDFITDADRCGGYRQYLPKRQQNVMIAGLLPMRVDPCPKSSENIHKLSVSTCDCLGHGTLADLPTWWKVYIIHRLQACRINFKKSKVKTASSHRKMELKNSRL